MATTFDELAQHVLQLIQTTHEHSVAEELSSTAHADTLEDEEDGPTQLGGRSQADSARKPHTTSIAAKTCKRRCATSFPLRRVWSQVPTFSL